MKEPLPPTKNVMGLGSRRVWMVRGDRRLLPVKVWDNLKCDWVSFTLTARRTDTFIVGHARQKEGEDEKYVITITDLTEPFHLLNTQTELSGTWAYSVSWRAERSSPHNKTYFVTSTTKNYSILFSLMTVPLRLLCSFFISQRNGSRRRDLIRLPHRLSLVVFTRNVFLTECLFYVFDLNTILLTSSNGYERMGMCYIRSLCQRGCDVLLLLGIFRLSH